MDVPDDQEPKEMFTNINVTDADNPAWAKGLIRYFDMCFMINPPVQIYAFICLIKLQKVFIYVLCPRAVADSHSTG